MKINNIKALIAPVVFILLIVLNSRCIKEEFDPSRFDALLDLESGLANPIGYSRLGVEKYHSDSLIGDELRIGEDGFLSLYYSALIDSGVMGDMISINDASVSKSILNQTGSVIFLNSPGISMSISDSINIPITSKEADVRFDSIKLFSGTIDLNVNSESLTGTVTFRINGLRQNGIAFSTTRNLANPDLTVSLSGYSLIPDHDASGNNLLECMIIIDLESPSGPVIPGAAIINVQTTLASLDYEMIYGDFGGYAIYFPEHTIPTTFFNQVTGGQIYFTDPRFKLFFSNSIGVPFGIYFNRIDAIDKNNLSHPLTGSGIPVETNPKTINYPSLSQAGQTIYDSLIFDNSNSNLTDFIATIPDSIAIEASAKVIHLAPPATSFIRYDSKYYISAEMELPLWGKADLLILLDTMDFDYLDSTLPPEEIERLIVRTSITNSFPVAAYPQIYLLDTNRVMLDSLFIGTEKIEGAIDSNGDGKADPEKQPPIDIDLPRSKIDNLLNTRYLLIKGRIMTTDFPAQDVKLYSSYFLDFDIGLIGQLKINTGKR
jgi:hypothetical protein